MAGGSDKKTYKENCKLLAKYKRVIMGVCACSWLVRFGLRYSSVNWTWHPVGAAAQFIIYGLVWSTFNSHAVPRWEQSGRTWRHEERERLEDGGGSLNSPGLIEYCWDILYLTLTVQVLASVHSDRWWWVLTIIPLFCYCKVVYVEACHESVVGRA